MSRTVIEDRNEKIDVADLRPLGDMVIVKVIQREKTEGGILLPGNKATELCVGEVVRAGPGGVGRLGKLYPMELKPNDIVFTMGYIGERMAVRSGEYRFVRDQGIWATVDPIDVTCFNFLYVTPRLGNIVVLPDDETMTRSGLLYHANGENAKADIRLGKILSVGPGPWVAETGARRTPQAKKGDRIVFLRYAGAEVTLRGQKVRIMNETDIRCFADEED